MINFWHSSIIMKSYSGLHICKDRPNSFPGWMSHKATKLKFAMLGLVPSVLC